jgi:hypothetical protein
MLSTNTRLMTPRDLLREVEKGPRWPCRGMRALLAMPSRTAIATYLVEQAAADADLRPSRADDGEVALSRRL